MNTLCHYCSRWTTTSSGEYSRMFCSAACARAAAEIAQLRAQVEQLMQEIATLRG